MAEILYTGQVAPVRLAGLIEICHFPENALVLAEQIPTGIIPLDPRNQERAKLLWFDTFAHSVQSRKDPIQFANYTSGRIFSKDAELRWEKQSDKMQIVYLGSSEHCPTPAIIDRFRDRSADLQKLTPRSTSRSYYLFGERLQQEDLDNMGERASLGDYAQVRIPRLLRYPVGETSKPYVSLQVCEYVDPTTGRVALFRFQKLKAEDRSQKPQLEDRRNK